MNSPSMFKALLSLKDIGISRKSPTPKFYHLLQPYPFPFSLKFFTTTSDPHSFAVSYLINNCGFSPESALKASKHVRFKTSQKPDSVLTFFRNHGFSDSDTYDIVRREPWLLSCNPNKRVLPKFRFLLSKGVSSSDIVRMVTGSPRFLNGSLENRIIPVYKLVNRFLQSDKKTFASIIYRPRLLTCNYVALNIKLLIDNGVSDSNIFRILRLQPHVICFVDLGKTVQELKKLGFDPSKSYFGEALLAIRSVSKSQWNEKIDNFKSWGWSEKTIMEAFMRQPNCMLASIDKINRVMRFWINQLGWDSSYLVKGPGIFGYSLEKRIIPRASVVHYLLSNGLRKESASLVTPFFLSEKVFLEKFVKCFEEEETSQLLKLYQEKKNLEDNGGNGGMSCSSNI